MRRLSRFGIAKVRRRKPRLASLCSPVLLYKNEFLSYGGMVLRIEYLDESGQLLFVVKRAVFHIPAVYYAEDSSGKNLFTAKGKFSCALPLAPPPSSLLPLDKAQHILSPSLHLPPKILTYIYMSLSFNVSGKQSPQRKCTAPSPMPAPSKRLSSSAAATSSIAVQKSPSTDGRWPLSEGTFGTRESGYQPLIRIMLQSRQA